MVRPKRKQVKKEPSPPVDDTVFGEEYVEYGSSSNAERPALSLIEDSSDSSSNRESDEGEPQDSDQGKVQKPRREEVSMRSQPSDDDDSSSDESFFCQMPIRTRQRFTTQEINTLEKVYQKSERPSAEVKQNLANKLGTTVNRIQIWFQNRRAKEKKTREQSKSADGPSTTVPDIHEPESSTRNNSKLRARRSSGESSRQVPSRHATSSYEAKRHQEKSRHIKKKKPAYQFIEDSPPDPTVEHHSVYPLSNPPPPNYYRYAPVELIPSGFYWQGHQLGCPPSRLGSGSTQPGQQEPIPTYVNPQKMLKKEHGTQYLQQTPRYPYAEPLLSAMPAASTYQLQFQEHASESSKSTSENTADDTEEQRRLLGKGELYMMISNKNTRRKEKV